MAEHPLRAIVEYPVVIGVAFAVAVLGAFAVVALLLIGFRKLPKVMAYLGDYEPESEVADA